MATHYEKNLVDKQTVYEVRCAIVNLADLLRQNLIGLEYGHIKRDDEGELERLMDYVFPDMRHLIPDLE